MSRFWVAQVSPRSWGAAVKYDTANWPRQEEFYTIHYGGGANIAGEEPFSPDKEMAVLRSWERYHLSKGWRGIAYNYAVGQSGTLYRLRGDNANGAEWDNEAPPWNDLNTRSQAIVLILGGTQRLSVPMQRTLARVILEAPMPVYWHKMVCPAHPTSCPGANAIGWCETEGYVDVLGVQKRGSRNGIVKSLKRRLWYLGYRRSKVFSTRFGKADERHVRRFQRDNQLQVTGTTTPEFWRALAAAPYNPRVRRIPAVSLAELEAAGLPNGRRKGPSTVDEV